MLSKRLGPAIYQMVVLFILQHALSLVPEALLLFRILLLGLGVVSLASLLWLARRLGGVTDPQHPIWSRAIIVACNVGAVLMAVAIVANILGSVTLADILTDGLLNSVFTALLLWVGAVVVQGAEAVVLRTETARRLKMVRSNAASIRSVTGKLVRFAAIALWGMYTLAGFRVLGSVAAVGGKVLGFKLSVGRLSISLLTILSALVAMWVIFKIAKLVRFVLETDVMPRVELPRGVPGTISKITNYVILLIGFFVVVGMLGLDLGKIAIIAGSLSVGIGFGLQNVVNNRSGSSCSSGADQATASAGVSVVEKGERASCRTWQGADGRAGELRGLSSTGPCTKRCVGSTSRSEWPTAPIRSESSTCCSGWRGRTRTCSAIPSPSRCSCASARARSTSSCARGLAATSCASAAS
jgi:hypothetical protein